MFAVHFTPVVVFEMAIRAKEWKLKLDAQLQCPGCENINTLLTRGYTMTRRPLNENIAYEVDELAASVGCQHCGIVSIMPQAEKAKLVSDLSKIVTPAWVENEKRIRKPDSKE